MKMKAYKAWDSDAEYFGAGSTVVFAESASKARAIALDTEACEGAAYTSVRVRRLPEMDAEYRGRCEIDWYDDKDRLALVKLGWHCFDPESWECAGCIAKEFCCEYRTDVDMEVDA